MDIFITSDKLITRFALCIVKMSGTLTHLLPLPLVTQIPSLTAASPATGRKSPAGTRKVGEVAEMIGIGAEVAIEEEEEEGEPTEEGGKNMC